LRHARVVVRRGVVLTWAYGAFMRTGECLINLRAPVELRAAAIAVAERSGTTMSAVCRDALEVFVAMHSGPVLAPVVEVEV
jgi:hypothetical protein